MATKEIKTVHEPEEMIFELDSTSPETDEEEELKPSPRLLDSRKSKKKEDLESATVAALLSQLNLNDSVRDFFEVAAFVEGKALRTELPTGQEPSTSGEQDKTKKRPNTTNRRRALAPQPPKIKPVTSRYRSPERSHPGDEHELITSDYLTALSFVNYLPDDGSVKCIKIPPMEQDYVEIDHPNGPIITDVQFHTSDDPKDFLECILEAAEKVKPHHR